MNKFLIILILLTSPLALGQDLPPRVSTIENQLEVLKIDTPGLEENININISQTTLSNFLLAISEIHDVNINVSPELNSIDIVNNFSNVSVADILVFLVKEYDLTIDFTGNIISVKRYLEPKVEPREKPIGVAYQPGPDILNLDLKNDPLDRVFRKIMDETGKNLLYEPSIEKAPLSLYLRNVTLDVALKKLAETNNLIMEKSDEGFYVFESAFEESAIPNQASAGTNRPKRKIRANFYYRVLDTLERRVEIDLQSTPIEDVIYALGDDLKLDIFTATPLSDAGTATITAEDITFDLLLDQIFLSTGSQDATKGTAQQNQGQATGARFTYKKEGNIYYFGTESQLLLKQTELVPLMYRSVQMFDDPTGGGQRRAGRNAFNTTGNFIGSPAAFNQPQPANFGGQDRPGKPSSDISLLEVIPDDIKEGLDIKIDRELSSFVVSGPGVKVERFKEFIRYIDKPVPVILIEVMILEVNRSALTETGISLGIGDQPVSTRGEFFPSGNVTIGAKDANKIIGNFDGFGSLNLGKVVPNFYLDIKAMESAGTLKVKSTPKLTTLNGHKAFLSSGETTYYAVTSQSFFGSQIPQTSEIRNYVPIDAELSLEILPIVSGNGQVTMDIRVIQSAFNGERIAEDAPPGITSREFSSIVRLEDQDVVVLGGIESIRRDDSGSGVPLLARIPIIKYLFSKRRREATTRNLNVLIKPTVIE